MTFLIDSIKERLGTEEEEDSDGFDDMDYLVGNTSGLDIGQVPGPIAQRVGRMAQIGGELMEIQISNPATFKIDRPELMRVIDGLEFDRVTLHGDPNIGFTSSYATGRRAAGYNIVHRYFQRYLEQMASFKRQMKQQTGVDIGYVNMHASNEQIPAREEQMASDKAMDPFGTRITEITSKPDYAPNIYRDRDFMELLFDFLIREKTNRREEFELYSQLFINHSNLFEEKWNQMRNKYADKIFDKASSSLDEKVDIFQAAGGAASNANEKFSNILKDKLSEDTIEDIYIVLQTRNLPGIRRMGAVFDLLEELKMKEPDDFRGPVNASVEDVEDLKAEIVEAVENEIWKSGETENTLPYEAKRDALRQVRDNVTVRDIEEPAAEEIRDTARKTFAGYEDYYTDKELEESDLEPHLELMDDLANRTDVAREIEKESTVFFNIMPAWMQSQDEDSVPYFIWKNIVERNKENGHDLSDFDDYQSFLDERSNELNVIAAVGVCYIWGHFTQKETEFEMDVFDPTLEVNDDFERPEVEGKKMTWIEWLHNFDMKVNLEAMYGGPGELRRVWRPKDIAIACHAIDKQARKDIEEWGEDDDLVKFTIDMEHTASYGVDPWKEVKQMAEMERDMAETGEIEADPDKALAKIVKTYHLTKPGWESQSGHRHGPFARGDETLYQWLYKLVEYGFARNPDDTAIVMFEVGGEYREEMYVIRVALDMIQRGIEPEDLNPEDIPLEGEYETPEQALQARFFGLDKAQFNSEMTKIEEHAFDPLENLLDAESFDHTKSGRAHMDNGGRPQEWMDEEYK